MDAWPSQGLWDGVQVDVGIHGFAPDMEVGLSINARVNPTEVYQFLPGTIWTDQDDQGYVSTSVPRYLGGFDCAPDNCMLVAYDRADPFGGLHATLPVTFGSISLFRFELVDENEPWMGGVPGDPILPGDLVEHGEFIWVVGEGFEPNQQYQVNQCKNLGGTSLCRNTWNAMPWAYTDGAGVFGEMVQLGKVMYGPWGQQPQWTVSPEWDLRDGHTVMVTGSGLPTQWSFGDWPPSWIGVHGYWQDRGDDPTVHYRSDDLAFVEGDVFVTQTVSQGLAQQLEAIVHAEVADGTSRQVGWDWDTGSFTYGYTGVNRWIRQQDENYGPYDPPPVENGYYDCADVLPPEDPDISGAQEPVHCTMYFQVYEEHDGETSEVFGWWANTHFARFDLTATTRSAAISSKPAGVTLSGAVTCTGFMAEQYLVSIDGTLVQQTGTGRKAVTVSGGFALNVTCSGTMTNPGTAYWSVFVPGAFKAGNATVTFDVRSPGFTRNANPLHVVQTVTVTAPPKGGGKR